MRGTAKRRPGYQANFDDTEHKPATIKELREVEEAKEKMAVALKEPTWRNNQRDRIVPRLRRRAAWLLWLEGNSYTDISAVLDISVKALKEIIESYKKRIGESA